MDSEYDFIVIGAGASGCAVAAQLAQTASRPKVVLLEAGSPNGNETYLEASERFNVAFDPNSFPNWGYKTVPQHQLNGQEVDYSRGRGLGGTTSINFCGWLVGPKDDYEEWARLTGDDDFRWLNVKKCLDRIQHLHPEIPVPELRKYLKASPDHSTSGKIDISYGGPWIPDIGNIFVAAEQIGMRVNADINDGDPIGLGMGTVNCWKGKRIHAAAAYLPGCGPNLTVVTNALVSKIMVENKRAVAVEAADGRVFFARKEIILSGGALNSPQLLLLSGIGPKEEIEKHSIRTVHDLPMVGKNLRDHCYSAVGIVVKHGPDFVETDVAPLCPSPMAFLKSAAAMSSKEFASLPCDIQRHLSQPTIPNFEIATHTPPSMLDYEPSPDVSFVGAICILDNAQSHGTLTLKSADPNEAPIIDPKFATHPFDRKVLIDGIRQTIRLLQAPIYAKNTIEVLGPDPNADDEEIWEHIRTHFGSSWHMSCTVKMGRTPDEACVDSNFKVFGLEGLRVADMSVCPFVPNNHVQSTAYVLGEILAEKLAKEYGLVSSTVDARL
ncbi:uncharacterized protein PV09_08267 [Verruconis gallopava]|uniref:Glucose-methanol-choline oxidoreductase N-terminal domain-containing protein n=1 Tax=Verruconis gallopava TaxID=253628 RepID=A0A0D2AM54_9PEZI|nr:uncharacterized protein PV09_08267 [Verruconis gallopava]KIW00229.1 hypothetical protein PV09_08267 [Verruconis gallopava]